MKSTSTVKIKHVKTLNIPTPFTFKEYYLAFEGNGTLHFVKLIVYEADIRLVIINIVLSIAVEKVV